MEISAYKSLSDAIDDMVRSLGVEGAILAIQNIDLNYYRDDPKAILYLRNLCLKHFGYHGNIHDDARKSIKLTDARRAFCYIAIKTLRLKPTVIQKILKCKSIVTVYNYRNTVEYYLANQRNFKSFVVTFDEIKRQYSDWLHTLI